MRQRPTIREVREALRLVDEALPRLSKRTKAYRLLFQASVVLRYSLPKVPFESVLKRLYDKSALKQLNRTSPLFRMLQKEPR